MSFDLNALYWLASACAAALFVYLLWALFKAEEVA